MCHFQFVKSSSNSRKRRGGISIAMASCAFYFPTNIGNQWFCFTHLQIVGALYIHLGGGDWCAWLFGSLSFLISPFDGG